jgi:hypothetical protein
MVWLNLKSLTNVGCTEELIVRAEVAVGSMCLAMFASLFNIELGDAAISPAGGYQQARTARSTSLLIMAHDLVFSPVTGPAQIKKKAREFSY